jgi:hypothetical protein
MSGTSGPPDELVSFESIKVRYGLKSFVFKANWNKLTDRQQSMILMSGAYCEMTVTEPEK